MKNKCTLTWLIFWCFFCIVCVSLSNICFSVPSKGQSYSPGAFFFRESSEHLSETKDAEPFLFRLIWLSSLLEPSHLLLSPSNLHNQITNLLLSSVAFDVTLSPQCFVWLLEINFLDTSLICKDLLYHLHFPSFYTPLRDVLLHITFAEIFVLIYVFWLLSTQ